MNVSCYFDKIRVGNHKTILYSSYLNQKNQMSIVFSKNIVKNVQFPNDGLLPCKIIITDLLHREDDKHIEDIYINIYKYDNTKKESTLLFFVYCLLTKLFF